MRKTKRKSNLRLMRSQKTQVSSTKKTARRKRKAFPESEDWIWRR